MEKISVVLITYNEEANIRDFMQSVQWADEIVLVDSHSTDRTVEIAREYTDKVYQHTFEGYSSQKNYGIDRTSHKWVLNLDADERVTPELREEITKLFQAGAPPLDGYALPFKVFFRNTWIRHGGWYPNYQIRLFRKDKGRFVERIVHERVEVNGKVGRLRHAVKHYTYSSISDLMKRLDHYSALSAETYYKEGRRVGWIEVIFRSWFTFVRMYILRRGFLDKGAGFQLAVLYSYYTFVKYAKLIELYHFGRTN